jgi:ATP-dependent Clp protease protease subunit
MTDMKQRPKREQEEILVNDFTEESAKEFRETVLRKSNMNIEKPLIINIDSYGGCVDALSKMMETLMEVPNPIITYCSGKAMSAGAILFSCGDMRYIGPLSRIMIHEISSVSWGNVHELKTDLEETERMNTLFIGILAKNCGMKGYGELRKYMKLLDGDEIYLSPEQCVKFGIADYVGIPKISAASPSYQVFTAPTKEVQVSEPPITKQKKATSKKKNRR